MMSLQRAWRKCEGLMEDEELGGNGETLFTPREDVCRGPKNKLPFTLLSKAADKEAA